MPIPWPPEVEKKFQAWFRTFALSKGWSTNPDHDKYDTDWRAAYFMGFRGIEKKPLKSDEVLTTTSGAIPESRFDILKRTANKKLVLAR